MATSPASSLMDKKVLHVLLKMMGRLCSLSTSLCSGKSKGTGWEGSFLEWCLETGRFPAVLLLATQRNGQVSACIQSALVLHGRVATVNDTHPGLRASPVNPGDIQDIRKWFSFAQ